MPNISPSAPVSPTTKIHVQLNKINMHVFVSVGQHMEICPWQQSRVVCLHTCDHLCSLTCTVPTYKITFLLALDFLNSKINNIFQYI